jgi:hypothetical protein
MGSIGKTLAVTVKVVTNEMWLQRGLKHSVYHEGLSSQQYIERKSLGELQYWFGSIVKNLCSC